MPRPISPPSSQSWCRWLGMERRLAERTVQGYHEDMASFVRFLGGHQGGDVALTDLAALRLADLRAWLAWRHAQDFARSSTARAVAGVRSFFRFVDRRHGIHNPALQAMRTPRLPHRLPRPLVEEDARDLITSARIEAREPWLGYRDTALLMLLYGGGLRIGEALAAEPPRHRRRSQGAARPARPGQRQQGAAGADPAHRGRGGGRLSGGVPEPALAGRAAVQGRARGAAAAGRGAAAGPAAAGDAWACRTRRPRTRCATASPPTCSATAPICGRSRSCWAMPACRRRRATPRSTAAGW